VIVSGGSPPVLVPCCAAMSKVTLLVVCTGPGVSGVWGREGSSCITGLAGPPASSPIISPNSLGGIDPLSRNSWGAYFANVVLVLVLKPVASLVTSGAMVEMQSNVKIRTFTH
jgi:hypothetical protein